ncbi:MAG TPA: cytochrome c oxidase assembly protein [Candidatus Cybelea sp.]|jgi:cytochrome c oxidase assembly factor CtaG
MNAARRASLYLSAAVLLFAATVGPPLDRLADDSFTWHMLQHLLLLYAVPLLAVLASPFALFPALFGKARTARLVTATRPLHAVAQPAVALAFFFGVLWATHFSGLFQLALVHSSFHLFEHALYLTAGMLFWLPVLSPPPLRSIGFPSKLLYLVIALPQGALVAMAIDAARAPLYQHYAVVEGQSTALADQHSAAAVMWIAGGLVLLCAFLTTLGLWAHRESGNDSHIPPLRRETVKG